MKNVIKFLLFIAYSTCIFFLPNNVFILLFVLFNLFIMIIAKVKIKKVFIMTLQVLPFIIFTFLINCLLDTFINSIWIGVKLLIVCNITVIYSQTTDVLTIAETIKALCAPLKLFKIDTDEIKVMVCISLSMLPILKKDLFEVKEACIAKNITFNVKNMKIILSKFFLSLLSRVNELEESLIAKGYGSE